MYIFYLGIHISVRTLSIVSTGANRPFTRNGSHFQRKTLRFGFAMQSDFMADTRPINLQDTSEIE